MVAFRIALLLALAFLNFEGAAIANASSFGEAISVEGNVEVRRRFNKLLIKPKDELLVKDQVNTGEKSSIEIKIGDKNHLRIDENTKMVLKKEEKPQGDKEIILELMAGSMRAKLDDLNGQVFTVRTPTAVAGVRGTDFITSFSPNLGSKAFVLTVISGTVEVFGIDAATKAISKTVLVQTSFQVIFNEKGKFEEVVKVNPETLDRLRGVHQVSNEGGKTIHGKKPPITQDQNEDNKDKKSNEKDEQGNSSGDKTKDEQGNSSGDKTKDAPGAVQEKKDSNQEPMAANDSTAKNAQRSEVTQVDLPAQVSIASRDAVTEQVSSITHEALIQQVNEVTQKIVQEQVNDAIRDLQSQHLKFIIRPND